MIATSLLVIAIVTQDQSSLRSAPRDSAPQQAVLAQVDCFVEDSAARFGAKMGGKKGNLTFTTFDGGLKDQRQKRA